MCANRSMWLFFAEIACQTQIGDPHVPMLVWKLRQGEGRLQVTGEVGWENLMGAKLTRDSSDQPIE